MMDRVRQAFLNAGLEEPFIQFNFGDPLSSRLRLERRSRSQAISGSRAIRNRGRAGTRYSRCTAHIERAAIAGSWRDAAV